MFAHILHNYVMPARNRVKQFVEHSYYHIYNRGVEKRHIFLDTQDYAVFLSYLKTYLLPKNSKDLYEILSNPMSSSKEKDRALKLLRLNNFSQLLRLLTYCLMPNHFHFLVRQTEANTIDRFTNSLFTRYTMYFNRKYKRVGPLFQGVYKAVLVTADEQLMHLSRYIHRNPEELLASQGQALRSYDYSSYPDYLGLRKTIWVKPDEILALFAKTGPNSYPAFVEDRDLDSDSITQISKLTLDENLQRQRPKNLHLQRHLPATG